VWRGRWEECCCVRLFEGEWESVYHGCIEDVEELYLSRILESTSVQNRITEIQMSWNSQVRGFSINICL
jgi:hypothetical protein